MKVTTKEATGPVLNYLVAKAVGDLTEQGGQVHIVNGELRFYEDTVDDLYSPSTIWAQGGPLIDQFGIDVCRDACAPESEQWSSAYAGRISGPTALIAAMRSLVVGTFGKEAEVPDVIVA
jgi:hypothetical protein